MQANTTVEELKEEFQFTLSKFSHEIRNPIALINSELQMLASSHPEITTFDCWEDLMDNLEYIKELLNELSNYNNAGRVSLKPTNLRDYLNTVISSVKPTLDYLGITLEIKIPDSLPTIPIDRVKMRQVLLNLLRNAQEALSYSQGKIIFRAEQISNGICISVEDNGCGMDLLQQEDIFSPFVTSKPTGTGLGLAVAKQIIDAHGGHIEVSSTPGHGSVFRIFLG
ncbi:MAG: ATP-binding protein [Eubacteriales bacterium]|nr:ATP-binding protein [Eubacteriales bacterium]